MTEKEKTLEQRVAELERVVRELIEYKQEIEIIKCDENGKALYRDLNEKKNLIRLIEN